MCSKQLVNWFVILLLLLVCDAVSARADVLVGLDGTFFGKIMQIDGDKFIFAKGCKQEQTLSFAKDKVRYYQQDDSCEPHHFDLPKSPFGFCKISRQRAYRVVLKESDTEIIATDVRIRKTGEIYIILNGTQGTLQGPFGSVESIVPDQVCPSEIPDHVLPPAGFCGESFKFAVNFSLDPVSNNQIFTKAFPIYVEFVGTGRPTITREQVDAAFGSALTGWASTLLPLASQLSPNLSDYLSSTIRRSKSFIMLVPPQTVLVDCKANAKVIIKIYTDRDPKLFPKTKNIVAWSQLEGRTIVLNNVDFQFRYDGNTSTFFKDDKLNLLTVFAHELGHSFGLDDTSDNSFVSIMNAKNVESDQAGKPTSHDGLNFVQILEKSVINSAPGFLSTHCAGFKVPGKYKRSPKLFPANKPT
jgi:hypothetical protein